MWLQLPLPRSYTTSFGFSSLSVYEGGANCWKVLNSFYAITSSCVLHPDVGCGWFINNLVMVTLKTTMWCFQVVSTALIVMHTIKRFTV